MTLTNAERIDRCRRRKRGEVVPDGRKAKSNRAAEESSARRIFKNARCTLAAAHEMLLNAPPEQPRQLRQPQRVTRWNVRTGEKREGWE